MMAANAIGDNTLQMKTQGYVEPESFTRYEWDSVSASLQRAVKAAFQGGDKFSLDESKL